MTTPTDPLKPEIITAALDSVVRGYQPIPLLTRTKRPTMSGWTHLRWDADKPEEVTERFTEWGEEGFTNIGLLLGEPSGGLIDVDFDHARTTRLKDHFLPRTPMRSGRAGRPNSHYWYLAEPGTLTGSRAFKMPDGSVSVELRSTGAQTVIPPSIHPNGEQYRWQGQPWGGDDGPRVIDGRVLAVQVALVGLGAVLLDGWPEQGGRHDAYLALAGGLLRHGEGVHPYWERNLPVLIRALAEVTNDDDGPEARVREVMGTTLKRLRGDGEAVGFTRLAEFIGDDHVRQVKVVVDQVLSAAGYAEKGERPNPVEEGDRHRTTLTLVEEQKQALSGVDPAERRPMDERIVTWQPVDLEPYLLGEVLAPEPTVLKRTDGEHLMYQGRVNMLYGSSESAKSWIALQVCLQQIEIGQNVLYLDFEDEPVSTLARMFALGADVDRLRTQFSYIHPETPLASMQRNKWGQASPTKDGRANQEVFDAAVERLDPSLIVADGMTALYGLHGLDTNDSGSTDVITSWLKRLTALGTSEKGITVLVIDHTTKHAEKGSLPIGSQHKVAMVQGTLLQAWATAQPVKGRTGRIELIVLKDRPGSVRAIAEEPRGSGKVQVAAVVTMDSTAADGSVTMSIDPPAALAPPEQDNVELDLEDERIARAVEEAEREWRDQCALVEAFGGDMGAGLSAPELARRSGVSQHRARRLLWGDVAGDRPAPGTLAALGVVERRGQTRSTVYRLLGPMPEREDITGLQGPTPSRDTQDTLGQDMPEE